MNDVKTIVVTGATRGIGKAIVYAYAKKGFRSIVCARNEQDLAMLQSQFKAENLPDVHTFTADLSQKQNVLAFIDFIKSKTAVVDVLVNNTGVFIPGNISNEAEGHFELMMNTNLYSAVYLTKGLLDLVKSSEAGYIFNMCSVASQIAYPNGGSYCVSKFALYGYTKVLRQELKNQGIRVTAVLPGATLTDSWMGTDLPEERFMKVEDVADAMIGAYGLSKQSVVEEIIIRPQLGDI